VQQQQQQRMMKQVIETQQLNYIAWQLPKLSSARTAVVSRRWIGVVPAFMFMSNQPGTPAAAYFYAHIRLSTAIIRNQQLQHNSCILVMHIPLSALPR
jgi:hypothetical protein